MVTSLTQGPGGEVRETVPTHWLCEGRCVEKVLLVELYDGWEIRETLIPN